MTASIRNGTTCFKYLSLILKGASDKISHFVMPLNAIANQNICFNGQNCIFLHQISLKQTFIKALPLGCLH